MAVFHSTSFVNSAQRNLGKSADFLWHKLILNTIAGISLCPTPFGAQLYFDFRINLSNRKHTPPPHLVMSSIPILFD
jgi:hypothetical protein